MNQTKTIAALFDFDGVVMDTESQYSIFWNGVGKKYHPEYEEFGKMIKGQTLRQIYDRYFAGMEKEQEEITEALNRFEAQMKYEYVPGVVGFMRELHTQGVKIAIVTSSNELVRKCLIRCPKTAWCSKTRFTDWKRAMRQV